ncbi:MAG: hypothetical protein E7536_07865 [Ruminococcaceae bacterium]|nr:hypothetical protein [Oscillospiraceae bacterium]
MKYKITSFFKKAMAAILTFFMSFCATQTPQEPERPQENTVTKYDTVTADYTLDIDASEKTREISDLLFGIFFEDINFAADGGLYAEKVVNRSFEYTEIAENDQLYGWNKVGNPEIEVKVGDKENGLNINNTNYLIMKSSSPAGIENRGFLDGMSVAKDEKYNLSLYAKGKGEITVNLCVNSTIISSGKIENITDEWEKYELRLSSDVDAFSGVTLQVLVEGEASLDMISLFPENTFKNRENGMRNDLGKMLEELEPKFLRFPGGCVIEGYDEETSYNWKDSIGVDENGDPILFDGTYGNVAARKQGINLWTNISATEDPLPCFMSYGLGFYEYFQLAEDIGALPVPVINCGIYCQMRGQTGIDMESDLFKQYIQDMHDLVEFCRGDENTKWGKVRISLGHEEPFELKYICIGNENEGQVYFERYEAFLDSFNEAKAENPELYKDLELIYSSGAFDATGGANYLPSYEYAKEWLEKNPDKTIDDFAGATDQHYYKEPEWFLRNTDYYDEENYKRSSDEMTDTIYGGAIPVFLGEYAARSNTLRAALAEAAYMTGLERNGDIVRMAAYAPLFGNLTATHWSPDLIWFNNHQVTGSINYYMQKIFSVNQGEYLYSSTLTGAEIEQKNLSGRVGVGTWYTSAEFDNVKILNNETGEILGEDDFSTPNFWWNWEDVNDSDFRIKNGKLVHPTTDMKYSDTGNAAYFGEDEWTNYTYTVEATKLDGAEGFIIPFAVQDKNNNYFWNLGGWGNTVSCLQQIENGIKTGQIIGTVKPFTAEIGKTYELKVVVNGRNVKCYIDNELYVDYTTGSDSEAEAYQVVSTDETGDIIIKLVNVTDTDKTFACNISGAENIKSTAKIYQVKGDSLGNDNILGAEEDCIMEEFTADGFSNKFNFTAPQYSVTVIRLHTK